MKRWRQSRWWWLALLLVPAGAVLFFHDSTVNVMHPALDELSAVQFGERWSHPRMLKIRELGTKAVPPLRRVLREKQSRTTRFLLWVKTKWPGATKYYSRFPDRNKLTERDHLPFNMLEMKSCVRLDGMQLGRLGIHHATAAFRSPA